MTLKKKSTIRSLLWKYLIYFCITVANWTNKSHTIIFEYLVWNYMKGRKLILFFFFFHFWANYSFKMYAFKTENVKEMLDCIEVYSAHFKSRNEICRRKRLWRLTEPETWLIYEEVIKTAVECCKAHVSENMTFDLTGWAPIWPHEYFHSHRWQEKKKKEVIKLFQLITQIGKPSWDLKSNYSRLLKSVTSRSASPGGGEGCFAPTDLILINYEDLASFSCLPSVLC